MKFLKIKLLIVLLLIGFGYVHSTTDVSQQNPQKVTGTITDSKGEALIGVDIVVSGSKQGVVTDENGKYEITVPSDGSLEISFIGYKKMTIPVKSRKTIDITLDEDTQLINEVVVVGYGMQRKATLTGAVSSLKGSEIAVTKNENVQNMLTGKVAGVRVTQRSAEPGAFNNSFDIRGMGTPLIVIDGIPRTMSEFQRLNPEDIQDLSVLKDASAAVYGVRSANGVVLVTTKKGEKGSKPQLSYSGTMTWQVPSGFFGPMNAVDFMTKANEGSMRNPNREQQVWTYSKDQMQPYIDGTQTGANWYDTVFRGYTPETQHNLSISGGNDRTNYYISAGYFYQNSFFKTDDRNYKKYNVLSNLSTKITKDLTFDMHLSVIADESDQPNQSSFWTIRDFWRMSPLIGPYADAAGTMYNHAVTEGENPFSFIHSDLIGWQKNQNRWFQGNGALKWDIPYIKGLSVRGMFSYNYYINNYTQYKKQYYQYMYNSASDTYTRYTVSAPSSVTRSNKLQGVMLWQGRVDYDRTFGLHKVNATVAWESQMSDGDNFNASRNLVLQIPYLLGGSADGQIGNMSAGQGDLYKRSNNGLIGKVGYSFADKYLLDAAFRYDGSSMFAPGHQWGFFPTVSAAWRISEEKFIKESGLSFINQLKLRGSYGVTGDDSSLQYQFVSGYNFPTASDPRNFTGGYVINGNFVASVNNMGIPNTDITWYTAKMFDVGADFEGWNGLFGFTVDYFNRNRDGLLATRNGGIPTVVGAALPQENINSDRTFGLELTLTHRHKIQDFIYQLSLMGSVTRVQDRYIESAPQGSSWDNWQNNMNNRMVGTIKGLGYLGHYTSWNQIWNSPMYVDRTALIGSYEYQDWNGDGVIDGHDYHPIGYNQNPWINYSLNFDGTYKRFDLTFQFQGAALGSLLHGEQTRGDSNTLTIMLDRYHPVDPTADPYNPATQWVSGYWAYGDARSTNFNNTTNPNGLVLTDDTYLRLKNLTLGYTLPQFKGCNLRIYVSAYNLLTFSKLKDVDPEHPDYTYGSTTTYGYEYPLNRTYSVGLTLKF